MGEVSTKRLKNLNEQNFFFLYYITLTLYIYFLFLEGEM